MRCTHFGESCFSLAPIQILEPWHPKAPRDWKPLSIHGKTAKQFVGDQQSRYIRIDVLKLDRYGIDNEEPVHMRIGFHVKTALADVLLRGLWAPFYSDMTDVRKYPSESKNDFTLDIGNKEIIIPSCQVKQIVQEGKSLYLEVHGAHVAHRSQKASMEVNMQWLRTYVSKSHWFKATKNDKKSSDKIPGSVCCGQIVSYHIESGMELARPRVERSDAWWDKKYIYDWFIEVYSYAPLERVDIGIEDTPVHKAQKCVDHTDIKVGTPERGMYHFNMSSVLSGGNLAIANKTGSSMKVFITGTEVDDPSSFEVYFVQKLRNTDDSDGGKGKKNGRGDKDDDDDDDVMGVVMYSIGGAVATVMVLSGLFVGYRRFNAQKYGHGNVAPMTIEVRPDPNDPVDIRFVKAVAIWGRSMAKTSKRRGCPSQCRVQTVRIAVDHLLLLLGRIRVGRVRAKVCRSR